MENKVGTHNKSSLALQPTHTPYNRNLLGLVPEEHVQKERKRASGYVSKPRYIGQGDPQLYEDRCRASSAKVINLLHLQM